jgi:O-antigen/teichoic acid export membrane protein
MAVEPRPSANESIVSFVRNALSLLATTAFITPLRLVIVVVLARLLSPDDLGIYTVTIAFATISMLIAQLGLSSSAVYRIRRLALPPAQVCGSVLVTCMILGGLSAGLLLLAEPLLAEQILPLDSTQAYRFGILIAFPQLLGASFVGVALGIDRFDIANLYRVVNTVGQLVGLGVVLGPLDGGLVEALSVVAGVHLLASGYLVVSVVRSVGISVQGYWEQLGPALRYGLKSHAQSLAGNLHEQIDIFMLAYLLADPPQIAVYSIAVGIITQLKLIPTALAGALFPEIAGRPTEEGPALAARAARHCFLSVSLVAFGIAVIAPVIVPLAFGEVYVKSVPIVLVLLPGMVLLANFLLLGRFFMAIDRQQTSISVQAPAVLLNVGLNAWLIPRYGIMGAAVSSLLSYAVEFVVMATVFLASTGQRPSDIVGFKPEDGRFYLTHLRRLRARVLRR